MRLRVNPGCLALSRSPPLPGGRCPGPGEGAGNSAPDASWAQHVSPRLPATPRGPGPGLSSVVSPLLFTSLLSQNQTQLQGGLTGRSRKLVTKTVFQKTNVVLSRLQERGLEAEGKALHGESKPWARTAGCGESVHSLGATSLFVELEEIRDVKGLAAETKRAVWEQGVAGQERVWCPQGDLARGRLGHCSCVGSVPLETEGCWVTCADVFRCPSLPGEPV